MSTTDDLALGYVLGTLDEEQTAHAAELLARHDRPFTEAIARANGDLDELRRGIALVAADATRARQSARAPWFAKVAGVAAALMLFGIGAATIFSNGSASQLARDDVATMELDRGTGGGSVGAPADTEGPARDPLSSLVQASDAIVVGRVRELDTSDSLTRASVAVTETIMGEPGARIVASDQAPGGPPWPGPGEDVLLFLSRVPEQSGAYHVVAEGRYPVVDGQPVGASFLLEQVREAARR